MKTIVLVAFMMLNGISYSQETANNDKPKTVVFAKIKTPEEKFAGDVSNGAIRIYTVGGLKPHDPAVTAAFQEKFGVTYHDFGCIAPGNMSYYYKYNVLVFQYLRETWGNDWQTHIKDNTIGLYKWKEGQK